MVEDQMAHVANIALAKFKEKKSIEIKNNPIFSITDDLPLH